MIRYELPESMVLELEYLKEALDLLDTANSLHGSTTALGVGVMIMRAYAHSRIYITSLNERSVLFV